MCISIAPMSVLVNVKGLTSTAHPPSKMGNVNFCYHPLLSWRVISIIHFKQLFILITVPFTDMILNIPTTLLLSFTGQNNLVQWNSNMFYNLKLYVNQPVLLHFLSSCLPTTWLNQISLKLCVCYEEPIHSVAPALFTSASWLYHVCLLQFPEDGHPVAHASGVCERNG